MPRLFYFYCLLLCWLLPMAANATHIVGGEMTYTCLGNNLYEIKFTIFRDCYNGEPWFDDPASIGIFSNADNGLAQEILIDLDLMLNDTLNPELGSECFVAPPNVCVHTTTYTAEVTLPFLPGGYHLAYQRCCRNQTISNLIAPEDVGATYGIVIGEQALLECNSSPVFNNWPPLYLCVNFPFQIDQSAVDPDGDSLVYRLCDPLQGADPIGNMPQPPNPPPYISVPWISPYNVDNQIGGVPTMMIDEATGLLTGYPNIIGQFVIGICVEEYRNGVLIGTKRRDYQVNIGECSVATAAFFAPGVQCENLTVTLNNESQNASDYLWFFNDPNNPNATSTLPNPSYTYSDTGLFNIVLVAQPGTICSDTFTAPVQLKLNTLFVDFDVLFADCTDEMTFQVVDSSVDSAANIIDWEWTLTQGNNTWTSDVSAPVFTLTESGMAELTLIVTSANGCHDTLSQPFPIVIFNNIDLADSSQHCIGNGFVPLNPDSAFLGANFNWLPPSDLDNPASVNPIASPDTTTSYRVVITDFTGFCQIERTVTVLVSPNVEVTPVLDTIFAGETVDILATFDSTYTYAWSPPTWLDDPTINDPRAKPKQDVEYVLTVTDTNGCVVQRTVFIVVITLCEEPYVFIPTGFTPNGDLTNDVFKVFGNDLQSAYLVVYDRWGEKLFETNDPAVGWDGTYKGKLLPPDAYGFYAEIVCVNGEVYVKKGNVTLIR